MSLHILDIAENSVEAGATKVEISINEDPRADTFTLRVEDNGRGIELDRKEEDPFFTSKTAKRFGLGIPLLAQAARECNGGLTIKRKGPGGGTVLVATFQRSHIDMKPLGNMGATMSALVAGHPELEYSFLYEKEGSSYRLDTSELRGELDGLPLNVPAVLGYVKEDVNDGIRRIRG